MVYLTVTMVMMSGDAVLVTRLSVTTVTVAWSTTKCVMGIGIAGMGATKVIVLVSCVRVCVCVLVGV